MIKTKTMVDISADPCRRRRVESTGSPVGKEQEKTHNYHIIAYTDNCHSKLNTKIYVQYRLDDNEAPIDYLTDMTIIY